MEYNFSFSLIIIIISLTIRNLRDTALGEK